MCGRVLFLSALSLLLCTESAAAAPATMPASRPALSNAEAHALRVIREVYQKEYVATATADRRALARKLLEQANQTRDDAVAREILRREARDVAAGAGDAPTAARAVRQLCQTKASELPGMMVAALRVAHASALAAGQGAVVQIALATVEEAVFGDDYASAGQLISIAQSAAEKGKLVSLLPRIEAARKELATLEEKRRAAVAAEETLAKLPDDPIAHATIGQFDCFIRRRWDSGLPHIAKGADSPLKKLAELDLAAPTEADRQLELANSWWDAAQREMSIARRHIAAHVGAWYRKALPGLSGLNRSMAQTRLAEIDAAEVELLGLEPGLAAQLFKGIDFATPVKSRIDGSIDFDWGEDAPDRDLTKDNFSIRWTGSLRVATGGQHELIVIANSGARLWIDEVLVIDAPNLSRFRNGQRFPLKLDAGIHEIRLDYWDTSGTAKLRLVWRLPGASKDEPIPAGAFLHDPYGDGGEAPPVR